MREGRVGVEAIEAPPEERAPDAITTTPRAPHWYELIFRSRRWLQATYCARGVHVRRWKFWRDGVCYRGDHPQIASVPFTGWEIPCVICWSAKLFEIQPRSKRPLFKRQLYRERS